MALDPGNIEASEGMSKAIFDKIDEALSSSLVGLDPETLEKVQDGWEKLSYAVAEGVVSHIKNESEVKGVTIDVSGIQYTQTNTVKVE